MKHISIDAVYKWIDFHAIQSSPEYKYFFYICEKQEIDDMRVYLCTRNQFKNVVFVV